MMVFDQTSVAMSNKTVPTISPAETKLETMGGIAKSTKSSSKQKKTGVTKSVSASLAEQKLRVGETLKKATPKELKSPKSSKSRSRSSSPPARSQSSKVGSTKEKKEKKEKKKKQKKSVSECSLSNTNESVTDGCDANSSTGNSNFPLHTNTPLSRSTSEVAGKKKSKKKISSKRTKSDSSLVAELIESHKSLGTSEHTTDTVSTTGSNDVEDSTSHYKKSSSKKKGKRSSEKKDSKSTADKSSADKSVSEEDDSVPLTTSPQGTTKKPSSKGRRPGLNSFESIHGKSIHKPKLRRGSMTNTTTDITEIRNGNQLVSPGQTLGILSSPPSSGTKKKSVLAAKREKQKLEHSEEENGKEELKAKLARTMVQRKKEDYIHEVLDIVNSDHNPKKKPDVSRDQFLANTPDPDECSSQSSSCSIVSDGSYQNDDLLSNASDHSDERPISVETPDNFGLDETEKSFEEASFAMEIESPIKSSFSDRNASPSEESYAETISVKSELLKSKLIGAMQSSMSALPEVDDEDANSPKPAASAPKSVLRKTALKGSKPPLRMTPKRSQSDVTSLKSISNLTNNVLRIRLPGQRKTVTRQRSLTFNEKVRVKRIPCQAQVADGDVSDLWFQPHEYEAIKRKTMALIRAVQEDQTGGVTYCTRGLERYFAVDNVQEKRNDAWDSVLDEQEAQRANREAFDADRISQFYSKTTRLSLEEAAARGKLDEDAISRYTKKMRQTLRRTISMPV